MKAPFQSSVVSHLPPFHTAPSLRDESPLDITQGCRWVAANLPPASDRFSLPAFQRRPKSPPTPPPRYPLTRAPAPRCSLPTKLSASFPGVDFAALSRMAGARGGEDRAAATVPPAAAPRLPPRPYPRHLGKYGHLATDMAGGTLSFGKNQGGLLLTKYVTMWASFCLNSTSVAHSPRGRRGGYLPPLKKKKSIKICSFKEGLEGVPRWICLVSSYKGRAEASGEQSEA